MFYPFQQGSQPITQWRRGIPPMPTRGADNRTLGALGNTYLHATIIPGGPEPIESFVDDLKANFSSFAIGAIVGIVGYRFFKGQRR
jgi:hypothetical protein